MSNPQAQPEWKSLGSVEQYATGSLTTVKLPPHQLVVAHTEEGELHVLDNRCPHEGYPLAQGDLKGCALTCCWHNWKFDVRDGSCTMGGEGVRRFASKLEEGELWCDASQPDPTQFFPAWRESLNEGLRRYDNGRAVRDGVRLLKGGYEPHELLVDIARYDARFAEYGTSHTLAVCADLTRVLHRFDGMEAMHPIAIAIDICGETNKRMPERTKPQPIPHGTIEDIRDAVESEELAHAEGLLLGAFDAGVGIETIDRWMFACLSDHFLGFGHPLIYMTKLQDLASDRQSARELYASLLYAIGVSTREDTLPYMHAYSSFLKDVESELEEVYAATDDDAQFDDQGFLTSILDDKGPRAGATLWAALKAGVAPKRIANTLVAAGAHRLLRFDVPLDASDEVAENWVWATHRLTFASAVRQTIERFEGADAIRFLFQAVAFINSGRAMDAPLELRAPESTLDASLEEVLNAIAAKDSALAVQAARGLLQSQTGFESLRIALENAALEDGPVRPIVVAHVLKTTFCAIDEYANLQAHRDRITPLLGVVRMLASPIRERRVQNLVHHSIAWVGEGRMPQKLTQ